MQGNVQQTDTIEILKIMCANGPLIFIYKIIFDELLEFIYETMRLYRFI